MDEVVRQQYPIQYLFTLYTCLKFQLSEQLLQYAVEHCHIGILSQVLMHSMGDKKNNIFLPCFETCISFCIILHALKEFCKESEQKKMNLYNKNEIKKATRKRNVNEKKIYRVHKVGKSFTILKIKEKDYQPAAMWCIYTRKRALFNDIFW